MTIVKICGEEYEKAETAIVIKEVKKGHTVLDIGANVGHFTILMAELVGKDGKVFAFEPDPESFEELKKNIEKYGYENVTLVKKAISDINGKASLYICHGDRRNNSLYDKYDRYIEVDTIRSDDYLNGHHIDFIKMDIQGGEVAALEGMSNILQNNKNVKMIIEAWTVGLIKAGTDIDRFVKLLLENKFQLFYIDGKTIDTLEFSEGKFNFLNIFCAKQEI